MSYPQGAHEIPKTPGFCFTNILESQDCKIGGGHSINSSLPLPPASQIPRH